MDSNVKVFLVVFAVAFGTLCFLKPKFNANQPEPPAHWNAPPAAPQNPEPAEPSITTVIPPYQDYNTIINQLKEWHQQAPDLTEIGVYGKSQKGQDLCYLRLTNKFGSPDKPKVLITACIHGNEPLSTSTTMAFIGTILDQYKDDEQVTKLVNTRDIYFVPVVCPDSYPHIRASEGVDPNRNFPTLANPNRSSVTAITALRDFFLQHKFSAAISGHTSGRVYLHPYGDSTSPSPNHDDFKKLLGDMSKMSGYRVQAASQLYGQPIFGTEVDWYYRQGAIPIVVEYGEHQRIPSNRDIQEEFNKTYKSTLLFIQEACMIPVRNWAKDNGVIFPE